GFLCARRSRINANIVANQVFLGVLADSFIRIDKPAAALVSHLAVVEDFGGHIVVRVGFGHLLLNALIEGFAFQLFIRGCPVACARRPFLRCGVALVQDVFDTSIDECVFGLLLIENLGLLVGFFRGLVGW